MPQKWDSETGRGGEPFANFKQSYVARASWLPPNEGLNRLADGFENYPVELYTSKACDERGMNYASYAGKWEKLPDFEALKPVKKGVLSHFDQEHLNGISLPYHKTVKKDGKDHRTTHPSALKATGYLKVEKAGDYTFSLLSQDGCRLEVGSKVVIENEGQENAREAAEVKTRHGASGPGCASGDAELSQCSRHKSERRLPQRVRPLVDQRGDRQKPIDGGCIVGTRETRGSEGLADQAAPRRMALVG